MEIGVGFPSLRLEDSEMYIFDHDREEKLLDEEEEALRDILDGPRLYAAPVPIGQMKAEDDMDDDDGTIEDDDIEEEDDLVDSDAETDTIDDDLPSALAWT